MILALLLALEPSTALGHPVVSFTLNETVNELSRRFAASPEVVTRPTYSLIQFHDLPDRSRKRPLKMTEQAEGCEGKYPWTFYQDRAGVVHSVVHRPAAGVARALLFPEGQFKAQAIPGVTGLMMWWRKVSPDTVLLATMPDSGGDSINEVSLMRISSVGIFYPWLADALELTK